MALDVDPVAASGMWWRQVSAGIDPLSLPFPSPDARWQRGSRVGGLYLAESAGTAWAEWYRWLSEAAVPPRAALPRDLARIAVEVEEVADLSSGERLDRVGLGRPRPVSGQWSGFQTVGEALFEQGFVGLLAPSAARKPGLVLCLFQAGDAIQGQGIGVDQVEHFVNPPEVPPGLRT